MITIIPFIAKAKSKAPSLPIKFLEYSISFLSLTRSSVFILASSLDSDLSYPTIGLTSYLFEFKLLTVLILLI